MSTARAASLSLRIAAAVMALSAAVAAVTPGEPGIPSVATPDPAATSKLSAWP